MVRWVDDDRYASLRVKSPRHGRRHFFRGSRHTRAAISNDAATVARRSSIDDRSRGGRSAASRPVILRDPDLRVRARDVALR